MQSIGIIAGAGTFPLLVIQGAQEQGLAVVGCGFYGNTDPALGEHCSAFTMLKLGQLGALIDFFKQHAVTQVCMAGAINKPKALDLAPDWRAAKVLLRLATTKGDDAILRAVVDELGREGICVVSPDALVPALRGGLGVLGARAPSLEEKHDTVLGWNVAKTLGAFDIGQCVVVRSGVVIAVEGIEGTDATIIRAGQLGGAGCTVVKVAKPEQDERLDLPSLGSKTLELLVKYKYACLAFEAGKTLFFDQQASLNMANAHGIAIIGVDDDFVRAAARQ